MALSDPCFLTRLLRHFLGKAAMQTVSVKKLSPGETQRKVISRVSQIWENKNVEQQIYEFGSMVIDQQLFDQILQAFPQDEPVPVAITPPPGQSSDLHMFFAPQAIPLPEGKQSNPAEDEHDIDALLLLLGGPEPGHRSTVKEDGDQSTASVGATLPSTNVQENQLPRTADSNSAGPDDNTDPEFPHGAPSNLAAVINPDASPYTPTGGSIDIDQKVIIVLSSYDDADD